MVWNFAAALPILCATPVRTIRCRAVKEGVLSMLFHRRIASGELDLEQYPRGFWTRQ